MGATLEALDALWARYRSGWRRLLSRGMVRELTLRASFDLDLLGPRAITNKVPLGTIPNCEACDDICCAGVENVVSLRLRDIATLMDAGRTELIQKQKPRFSERMLRSRPGLNELLSSELWLALPVIKQVGERRICAALTPDIRCSLHPSWPTSCERFPYSLNAMRRQVTWGTRCPSKQMAPEHVARSKELFDAAIASFNERVRDAVLLAHAPRELDRIGIGAFLTKKGEDPFEPPARLPIWQ